MEKFCENCGAKLNEKQDVCLKCGRSLQKSEVVKSNKEEVRDKYCENCGNKVNVDNEYCLKCGKRIVREESNSLDLDTQLNEKPNDVMSNIGIFILLLIGYLLLPQIIGSIMYYKLHLSENLSMAIGNICFVVVLVLTFYKMFMEKIKDYFSHFSQYFKFTMKWWGIGLAVMYISNIIINLVIFRGDIAANEELNRQFIQGNPFLGLLSVAFITPFVEEMIFRFGIRTLSGRNKYFPLVSALAFGIPHVIAGLDFNNFFAFSNLLEFVYVIPYGALGYVFGVIYNRTDNIFCSMTAHFFHNLMCFVIILWMA